MRKTIVMRIVMVAVLALGSVSLASGDSFDGWTIHRDRVLAGRTDRYTVYFRAGEVARVVVTGDHTTDLDLEIRDEYGNVIVRDFDYTDNCVVRWVPKWTGPFTIRVINRGSVYNDYTISHN